MALSAQELIIRMEERIVDAVLQRIDEQFAEADQVADHRWSVLDVRLQNMEDLIRGAYTSTKRRLAEINESVSDLAYKIDPDDEHFFTEEDDVDEDGDDDDDDDDDDDEELSGDKKSTPRAFSAPPTLPYLEGHRPAIKVTPATPHSSQPASQHTLDDTLDLEIIAPKPGNGSNSETDAEGEDDDMSNMLGHVNNSVPGPDVDMGQSGAHQAEITQDVVMGDAGNNSTTPSGNPQSGSSVNETNTSVENSTDNNAEEDAGAPQPRQAQAKLTADNARPSNLQVPGPIPMASSPRRSVRQRSVSKASLVPHPTSSTRRLRSQSPFAPTEGGSA